MANTGRARPRRMSADERKQAILQAAAPVLAQAGLHGTSVKEIAEAAGVSEALLYKHFPSKQAIYDEALAAAREFSKFTISRFARLEPGTEAFVLLTYATIDFTLFGFPGREEDADGGMRLVFQSLLSDGEYARSIFADTAAGWMDYVTSSYLAAITAGDLVEQASEPAHRFRFVQQLSLALRLSHLPATPAFGYRGTKRELANEAIVFSLRGVGLTDAAIARYFKPVRLAAMLAELFPAEEFRSLTSLKFPPPG